MSWRWAEGYDWKWVSERYRRSFPRDETMDWARQGIHTHTYRHDGVREDTHTCTLIHTEYDLCAWKVTRVERNEEWGRRSFTTNCVRRVFASAWGEKGREWNKSDWHPKLAVIYHDQLLRMKVNPSTSTQIDWLNKGRRREKNDCIYIVAIFELF